MAGLFQHLLITLRLNMRSRQALLYGYLVPIFFLIAFASVFRSDQPRLTGVMGMLLTVSILGGACFGMPTAMVAERERGVWRRYRLLPAASGAIVLSTMAARLLLLASTCLLQIALARWIYSTPWPDHPWQLAAAFCFSAFAFEGMGLTIAMLADTVPAVQALGQSIFLPMILIGGVGVPLRLLPPWARQVAAFLPGRYSVDALQSCVNGTTGLSEATFSLAALLVIGLAACLAAAKLFRWDAGQKHSGSAKAWAALALAAWAAVGLAAPYFTAGAAPPSSAIVAATTRPQPFEWRSVTDADANAITYGDLQDDQSPVTPLISSPQDVSEETRRWMADFAGRLANWPPANVANLEQRVRNVMSLAADADLGRDAHEAEIPYLVFAQLKIQIPRHELIQILTWIIGHPNQGTVFTAVPDLGIGEPADEPDVRDRCVQYSKKLLGRLLGKIAGSP